VRANVLIVFTLTKYFIYFWRKNDTNIICIYNSLFILINDIQIIKIIYLRKLFADSVFIKVSEKKNNLTELA